MNFHIITIFPGIFDSYFSESIIKRAQEKNKINIKTYDLRDWTKDKHKSVDDTPYGGGAGMVMRVDILYKAIVDIKKKIQDTNDKTQTISNIQHPTVKTVLTSAKGGTWNQAKAKEFTELSDIIIVCGRYEGVDERILSYVDEEVSIGDYVLTGGEIAAMTMVDSVSRLLPGVLGNAESPVAESHTEVGVLEYPQYTRPESFVDEAGNEHKVPEILLSGNHGEIEKWRESMKKKKK